MPIIGFPHSLLQGLSDFWQRFFADADQLEAMYQGAAVLAGQAYLDLLENVLSLSMADTPLFDKEFYKLITIREDQVQFVRGASLNDDRWAFSLPDNIVAFVSLDNRVIEPTASLQKANDYDLASGQVLFRLDPTNPNGDGVPLNGFARRSLDVAVGGAFDDSARGISERWQDRDVRKGDQIRLLDVSADLTLQRRRADYTVTLVRDKALYVDAGTPLPAATTGLNFVVLRRPYNYEVVLEAMTFVSNTAQLAHTRLDPGSVVVHAKGPGGEDVVEGVDYKVDYEAGKVYKLTTWKPFSANKVDYTWRQEVWPAAGPSPRFSMTGAVLSTGGTTRVVQMALWAPDTLIDHRRLANNFGALIGVEDASSEAYRAFLRGVFQLYILGPVLERVESALNVVLGLPVVRDDGEVLVSVDLGRPAVNVVTTKKASGAIAEYDFPKTAPLRKDLVPGLVFQAFEPLTSAVTVTDYVEDPTWWHGQVIPRELLAGEGARSITRRTASPIYVKHVTGAPDQPMTGDPGLIFGADENGFVPPPGHPIFRHRLAFVLMDRFLKYHTFIVKFDPAVFAGTGAAFARSLDQLNALVSSSKPSHTYVFVEPTTAFDDEVDISDSGVYQPQRYAGADPDAPEIYPDVGSLPGGGDPYAILGLFFNLVAGSPSGQPDKVLFQDAPIASGADGWSFGDFFHYELSSGPVDFPLAATPVTISSPTPPRRIQLVRVYVGATIGGKAVVESVDYTVDYVNATVTRLTAWDVIMGITVGFVQLNIGNPTTSYPNNDDVVLLSGGNDPANVRAVYDPAAVDWMGALIPVTNHRDLSLVERTLTYTINNFCSLAGTPVWTLKDAVPVEKCVPGTRVAMLGSDGLFEVTVHALHERVADHKRVLRLSEGTVIETTDEHPFYTTDGEKKAGQLLVGDLLIAAKGPVQVLSTSREEGTFTVYNLRVDDPHRYLVGAPGVMVHNK